jgi:hypothetical protein
MTSLEQRMAAALGKQFVTQDPRTGTFYDKHPPKPPTLAPNSQRDFLHVATLEPKVLNLTQIRAAVGHVCQMDKVEFESCRRTKRYVEARHIFFYLARCFTSTSLPRIGRFAGGRDHTTVLHGQQRVRDKYSRFRDRIKKVCAVLGVPEPPPPHSRG